MPVYTVHAPVTSNLDLRATDRFTFVRDGFHLWAALLGMVWLAWHRLWLALLGWVVLMIVVDVAMIRLGVSPVAVFLVDCLLALLLGFEAASLQRWTLSRGNSTLKTRTGRPEISITTRDSVSSIGTWTLA